jgi:structure-specific endonuclease subunit SLX1
MEDYTKSAAALPTQGPPDINGEVNTSSRPSYVYLLVSSRSGNTYVGATMDLDRRLRQHNQEIKGGARATGAMVSRGEVWHRHCYVSGFPDWQAALQFEWRWKQLTRKRKGGRPLERRMDALQELCAMDRSTTAATPFAEWPTPREIHMEMP